MKSLLTLTFLLSLFSVQAQSLKLTCGNNALQLQLKENNAIGMDFFSDKDLLVTFANQNGRMDSVRMIFTFYSETGNVITYAVIRGKGQVVLKDLSFYKKEEFIKAGSAFTVTINRKWKKKLVYTVKVH